jgi:hypothetical protein
MWDNTPWFVGGGAQHSPEVARLLAYASTNGTEGIVNPPDLKVQALNIPGTSVRVAPGGALILNRFPGGTQQTYVGRNPIEHTVAVTPTGSAGGRTDLVVAYVDDPQYSGQSAPDPLTYQYINTKIIQNVPAAIEHAHELNLNYPAIELAKITLPPSTGTVTPAMITDLRKVAQPRQAQESNTNQGKTTGSLTSDNWVQWPNYRPSSYVPEWATHVQIRCFMSGMKGVGPIDGSLKVGLYKADGTPVVEGPEQLYDVDSPGGNSSTGGGAQRFTVILAAYGDVRAYQGQRLIQGVLAHRLPNRPDRGTVSIDASSQMMYDVYYYERPI